MEITPAILAHHTTDARDMLRHPVCLAAGRVHLDVLDGSLFDARSVWRPEELGPLPPGVTLELHLMVADPQPVVIAWRAAHAGPLHAIYQPESPRLTPRHLTTAHTMGCSCAVALSPNQHADALLPYLESAEEVLVMGVQPGASGQSFLGDHIWSQVARVRALAPTLPIALDGGVTSALLPRFHSEGIQRLVASSALWSHSDPLTAYNDLLY